MKVIKITPRGYCHGVVNAIQLVKEASKSYQGPIYVLGMIVHNKHVSDALQLQGVTTLDTTIKTKEEWIDSLDQGLVIFTAHGTAPAIKQRAIDRGLSIIDASCRDVLHTQNLIADYRQQDYDIIYIGKKGHPEAEAMQANDPHVHLVQSKEDIDQLHISTSNILVTNQTTMSILDIQELLNHIQQLYPHAIINEEVCAATRTRQQAVLAMKEANVLVVVGDSSSNNSQRLYTINQNFDRRYMVESVEKIEPSWFHDDDVVAVSSGASTPTYITNQVIAYLEQLIVHDASTHVKPVVDISKVL